MAGIFKAYDIRGIYPDDVNDELFYKLGRAIVVATDAKKLVVGHDMRFSSPHLHESLIQGVTDQGCDVIDIGLASTPMVYFAAGFFNIGSAEITASHNPPEYNGCKLTINGTHPIGYDTGINEVERLVKEDKFPEPKKWGSVAHKNIKSSYATHVKKFAGDINKSLKIVIDFGNGIDAYTVPFVFKDLKISYTPMYNHIIGTFPHHIPNPLEPKNMLDLQHKVLELKADIGIAFDGDGDRAGFVDDKGNIINNDLVTAFFAKHLLENNKGATICYDLRSSVIVPQIIRESGGNPVMTKVGHVNVKKKMRELDCDFAGELSGHYYFKDNYFCDSAIIAALRFLTLISKENKPVSDIFRDYRKYVSSGEINSEVVNKTAVIHELKNSYKNAYEVHDFDGILKRFEDWWFLVRPSNTEPVLRLIVEANTKELMQEKVDELLKIIRQ